MRFSKSLLLLILICLSFNSLATTESSSCEGIFIQLSASRPNKKAKKTYLDSALQYQINLLPEPSEQLSQLTDYLSETIKPGITTQFQTEHVLKLAQTHLRPDALRSFSDWLYGQFQEDPIVSFEDHYLGRQKQAFPGAPNRYNKNGERPFDGYVAARKTISEIPLEKLGLSEISKLHKDLMSRESHREDSGAVFHTDRSFPKNSQGLKDSELGVFRDQGVGFEAYGKYIPSSFSAIARPIEVVEVTNSFLVTQPEAPSKISYAPLSQWRHFNYHFPFSSELVEKLESLSKNHTKSELDKNESAEINTLRQKMVQELTESIWKIAKKEITEAQTREDVIRVVAEFQKNFISVHPFYDGNGRVARLLTEKLLNSRGLPSPIYTHWGEDVALSTSELEAHLARSVFNSEKYHAELNQLIPKDKSYEEHLNPAVKARVLELLGDPTGHFDSHTFTQWLDNNRSHLHSLSEAVSEFSKAHPKALSTGAPVSKEEFQEIASINTKINPQALVEEFQFWRKENGNHELSFNEQKQAFSYWLYQHSYTDNSGTVRLLSPQFQQTFAQLSETEALFKEKRNKYYSEKNIYRGVPTDRYLNDIEFVKLFAEQSPLTTGNGVYPERENVLPVFQRFNISFLRDEMRMIKQAEGHAGGSDSKIQYETSGMVSFTDLPDVADAYQFSQDSQLGFVFTAKKRLVGAINTAKSTPSMHQPGYISEKEEALVGGVDPESFQQIRLEEKGKTQQRDFSYLKKSKVGERIGYNQIRVTEVFYDAKGNVQGKIISLWKIHPDGSVEQIKKE